MAAIAPTTHEPEPNGLRLAAEESMLELIAKVLVLQGSPRLKLSLIWNALELHLERGATVDEIARSPLRTVTARNREIAGNRGASRRGTRTSDAQLPLLDCPPPG